MDGSVEGVVIKERGSGVNTILIYETQKLNEFIKKESKIGLNEQNNRIK